MSDTPNAESVRPKRWANGLTTVENVVVFGLIALALLAVLLWA